MHRQLLLLRHGKSDWSTGVGDFHRPLKDRGKRDAQRVGTLLPQQDLVPDHVVSSPAERAVVTAEKCVKAMGMSVRTIELDRRVYAASVVDLLAVLHDLPPQAQCVLLVGHNPGLEDLLVYLSSQAPGQPADGKLLPTATLAVLQIPDHWAQLTRGGAHLASITRPAALPEKFPFITPSGVEQRDRPAYYYTQSSVIPYRVHAGRTEILLVSSSKQKHWVVPKGIVEPGCSAQDSAAKEALEEAGVEGRVTAPPLGKYRYEKWGATCTVDVFPMEVTRLIAEDDWEESHRGREWVSVDIAMERLRQEELKPMVEELAATLDRA